MDKDHSSLHKLAVEGDLSSHPQVELPLALNNDGDVPSAPQTRNSAALDQAIETVTALVPTNVSRAGRALALSAVAGSLVDSKSRSADRVEVAMTLYQLALDLLLADHQAHSTLLQKFILALKAHAVHSGVDATDDLDNTIGLGYSAFFVLPNIGFTKGCLLNILAGCHQARFELCGDYSDLDGAIELHRHVLDLCQTGDPLYAMTLMTLVFALDIRHEQYNDNTDRDWIKALLEEIINISQYSPEPASQTELTTLHAIQPNEALQSPEEQTQVESLLQPCPHTGRIDCGALFTAIAGANYGHFCQLGDCAHLDAAIASYRKALDFYPSGHQARGVALNSLAVMLLTRFQQCGNRADLDNAFTLHHEALQVHPSGHPDRGSSLGSLANVMAIRFAHFGDRVDLDSAINFYQEALKLHSVNHPKHALSLSNLANALHTRFEQLGDQKDLDNAVALHWKAFDLCPVGHPNHSTSLINLADTLSTRFKQLGYQADLDSAITLHKEALDLCPVGHPDHGSSLNNLANILCIKFQQSGDSANLDSAVILHQEALALHPAGHPGRDLSLSNLAVILHTRFEQLGDCMDLDHAVALHQEALALRPAGHPHHGSSLTNLAGALHTRFRQLGNHADLNRAVTLHTEALKCHPIGHPNRSTPGSASC